jgi:acyl dehydratase
MAESDEPRPMSLITDEMRSVIGKTASYSFEVEKGDISRFARAAGVSNPIFFDEVFARSDQLAGIVAPPTYLIVMRILETEALSSAGLDVRLNRGVDGGSVWQYFHPIRPGDKITAVAEIADIYERQGSETLLLFVMIKITYKNQFDQIVVIQDDTRIWYE